MKVALNSELSESYESVCCRSETCWIRRKMTTWALFSAAAVTRPGGGSNTSIGSDVVYTSSNLSVTSEPIGYISTTKAVFVQTNSTSVTTSQTTTNQVFSTIPSSQLTSETFAVIVGCSVAAAVLVTIIIVLTACCIVRPILRSRKKAARVHHTAHHETIYGYKPSVTDNMEQPQKAVPVISATVRSTSSSENLYIMYSGHAAAVTKSASQHQHVTSSEYLPSAVFKPAVTAASTSALPGSHYHDNWYGRGMMQGSKEPMYGQQLASDSRWGTSARESYGSVENFMTTPVAIGLNDSCVSINSTTPLYREKQESRDAANDDFSPEVQCDQNVFSVTASPVADVPVTGRRPTVNDSHLANPAAAAAAAAGGVALKQSNKRPAASQLSSKSVVLTEDVWNSTVDIAFDSALSLHEPL